MNTNDDEKYSLKEYNPYYDKNYKQSNDRKNDTDSLHLSLIYKPLIEFTYVYDFDENGIFFYLGTLGGKASYVNPHILQQVKVFSSSLAKGYIYDLVGRNLVNLRTLNEFNSFFGVDLGEDRFLIPTAYTLRNRNSSSHVLLNWVLEGSNDKIQFEILDSRSFKSNNLEKDEKLENERIQLKVILSLK